MCQDQTQRLAVHYDVFSLFYRLLENQPTILIPNNPTGMDQQVEVVSERKESFVLGSGDGGGTTNRLQGTS